MEREMESIGQREVTQLLLLRCDIDMIYMFWDFCVASVSLSLILILFNYEARYFHIC